MKISIITPFYKGNKYMKNFVECINKSVRRIDCEVELIMVNDSPDEKININGLLDNINLLIINNKINEGIHKSRINGLKKSSGDYILFLDQDDFIDEDFFYSNLSYINKYPNYDMIVGNGIEELQEKNNIIYKNKMIMKMVSKKRTYFSVRNFIFSPGQCLIKKKSIPDYWLKNILKINGADDYYLWILMLCENKKFIVNPKKIYIHKNTGSNLSNNQENMYKSELEMLSYLKNLLSKKDYNDLKALLNFRYNYKNNKKIYCIIHPLMYFYKIFYAILWRI